LFKLDIKNGNFNVEYGLNVNNSTDIYSLFTSKRPWAMYFAEDWSGTTLPDSSGNGRNATTGGTITKTTASGNGADGLITYISGGTNSIVTFPSGSIPSNFTILGLTRYNSTPNKKRILQGSSGDWYLGHYNGTRGVAKFDNLVTSTSTVGTIDDWLCSIGKNSTSGTVGPNILMDGTSSGTVFAPTNSGNRTLGINVGNYSSNQSSEWSMSCVMIWDSLLTDTEMVNLNTMINNYKSSAIPIKYQLKNLNINSDIYLNANLFIENGKIINKTTGKNITLGTENQDRLIITNIGNVGIGSTIPITNLDIGTGSIRTTELSNIGDLKIRSTTGNTIFYSGANERLRIPVSGALSTNNNDFNVGTANLFTTVLSNNFNANTNLNI